MLKILLFLLMLTNISFASTVTTPYVYSTNDTVTNVKLNSNQNAITNVVNGGLDNNNANTTSGYHFFQTVGALPVAGNQGSVYFLTSDNTLNFDTGSTFIKSVVTASNPTVNSIVYWNGSAWATGSIATVAGAGSLVPSGAIFQWSGTVATIPSGYVLCNGSNSTPDLRDKFIVGAKQDSGGAAKTNITGSLTQSGGSVTIAQANLPAVHLNLVDTGVGHSGQVYGDTAGGGANVSWKGDADNSTAQGAAYADLGGSGTAYTQPYYALCFIMKM